MADDPLIEKIKLAYDGHDYLVWMAGYAIGALNGSNPGAAAAFWSDGSKQDDIHAIEAKDAANDETLIAVVRRLKPLAIGFRESTDHQHYDIYCFDRDRALVIEVEVTGGTRVNLRWVRDVERIDRLRILQPYL